MVYRGSRKHILEWVKEPQFREELIKLRSPAPVRLTEPSYWAPREGAPEEAELDTFGPAHLPHCGIDWQELRRWWLAHDGKNPTWDLMVACTIEDRPGLLLVEAKANVPELNPAGKALAAGASLKQRKNHERIGSAIEEARRGLAGQRQGAQVNISRDGHYQLSNRLAFTWKLATLGLPTVLVYLRFLGDDGIRDVGEPFADKAAWIHAFHDYIRGIFPSDPLARPLATGGAPCWVLARSQPIREVPRRDPPGDREAQFRSVPPLAN